MSTSTTIDLATLRADAALRNALDMAGAGYPVFPCAHDKAPMVAGGFKAASKDLDAVRSMWTAAGSGAVLVGVATGERSGVSVLDIDVYKPEGQAWLDAHASKLPETYAAMTLRGGRHFWFKHRQGLLSSQRPGVDVRADGGYVIFWPAVGCPAVQAPIAPWPVVLDELLATRERHVATATPDQASLKAIDVDVLAAIVRQIPNNKVFDERNVWVGFCRAIQAGFADASDLAEELWYEHAAKRHQRDGEAEKVWNSVAPPHQVGADHIVRLARECGVNTHTYDALVAAREFAAQPLTDAPTEPPAPSDDLPAVDDVLAVRERVINAVIDAGVTFWRDEDGNTFATVKNGERIGRYRVRSRKFKETVRCIYGVAAPVPSKRGARPGSIADSVLNDVLPALEALAVPGDVRRPRLRCAAGDDSIVVDLCDDTWRAVRVSPSGWLVLPSTELPLVRSASTRALPEPIADPAALHNLRRLLNLPAPSHDAAFRLVVAWLVAALFPTGPYAILAVDGEQGSGKSTTCRMLRRLVDPNAADLRAMPRNEDDLLIAANNGHVVAFDNVSAIDPDMADAICRVATGAGFGKRMLYTDQDEVVINVCRPCLLNGIPSLLARGDVADRAIAVTLPPIPDHARRPESEVWSEFELAAPGILAVLLDGVSTALRRLPGLRLPSLPRMADFARIACAAAPAFGWTENDMLTAIAENREAAVQAVLDADPIAEATCILTARTGRWTGTASALLAVLTSEIPNETRLDRAWPRDAARLSARLKRLAPALRRAGVHVELPASGGRRGRQIVLHGEGG